MTDQNVGRPRSKSAKTKSKTTVVERGENRGLSQLSVCCLAVCWSWASYYTSSERGHPRLPADMKIRTVVQLIGILWSYFGMLRGLPTVSYVLLCHSAASWSI